MENFPERFIKAVQREFLIPAARFVNPLIGKFNPEFIDSGKVLRVNMERLTERGCRQPR